MYQYKDIPIDDRAFGLLVQSFSVSNELFTRQCAQWLILTTPYLLQAVKLGLCRVISHRDVYYRHHRLDLA